MQPPVFSIFPGTLAHIRIIWYSIPINVIKNTKNNIVAATVRQLPFCLWGKTQKERVK